MDMTMLKALVTGGTGFVGQALTAALVAAGHEVRATTRDLSRAAKARRVEWVRCDVDDRADVERALEGIDAAYFLWKEIDYEPQWTFDKAARAALQQEVVELNVRGVVGKVSESMVQFIGPKLDRPGARR
jgi:uncharacterized protein YbjT (DUF2867 family)